MFFKNRRQPSDAPKQAMPMVGDVIFFGKNNWEVLAIQDRMALIISCDSVCQKPYHHSRTSVTWENCSLRKWLNDEFINTHFTSADRARIKPCRINNDDNPNYGTPGGAPTSDRVFLLSIGEAENMIQRHMIIKTEIGWWLRSPGQQPDHAAVVTELGYVSAGGRYVEDSGFHFAGAPLGVRPVLWLSFG